MAAIGDSYNEAEAVLMTGNSEDLGINIETMENKSLMLGMLKDIPVHQQI